MARSFAPCLVTDFFTPSLKVVGFKAILIGIVLCIVQTFPMVLMVKT